MTIKKNGAVLWQQTIAAGDTTGYSFNLSNTVAMGDQLDFVTNKLTTSACDNTVFRPTIVLTTSGGGGGSSTTYSAVADFSGVQGQQGWYYLSSTGAQLTWNGNFWSGTDGYIGLWDDGSHPGNSTDAVRRWVAPSAGSVQITGTTFDGDTSCGIDGVQCQGSPNSPQFGSSKIPRLGYVAVDASSTRTSPALSFSFSR